MLQKLIVCDNKILSRLDKYGKLVFAVGVTTGVSTPSAICRGSNGAVEHQYIERQVKKMLESSIRELPTAGLHILAIGLKRNIVGNLMLNIGTEQEQLALDLVKIELMKRGEQR